MPRVITSLLACVILAPALGATVLIPAEFREVVAGSETIAHVRILDVRPQWVDGRRRVQTLVTAEVLAYFKGGPGATIVFKVPGGELGRYRTAMPGAPVFARGEEAVLFLRSHGDAAPAVFGFNQGVFRVAQDSTSGRRIILQPALIASGSEPEIVRRGSPARRAVPLDAFGAQVRAVIAEQRAGAR